MGKETTLGETRADVFLKQASPLATLSVRMLNLEDSSGLGFAHVMLLNNGSLNKLKYNLIKPLCSATAGVS